MKLYAISDLHLNYDENRNALSDLQAQPEDWLILGGDVGEKEDDLRFTFDLVCQRFAKVIWVPGNHELWLRRGESYKGAVEKYEHFVSISHEFGVLTPEDPYPIWEGEGGKHIIAPLFVLYDYSFRPDDVPEDKALTWAAESGVICRDEYTLDPAPYPSKKDWCHDRVEYTEKRLQENSGSHPFVLINHFPLRYDLIRLSRIPRFSLWCGTKKTEEWHIQFPTTVVVSGHLHMRATDYRDGVRFEEVSLGYPSHWRQINGIQHYLREILPGPQNHSYRNAGPFWRF